MFHHKVFLHSLPVHIGGESRVFEAKQDTGVDTDSDPSRVRVPDVTVDAVSGLCLRIARRSSVGRSTSPKNATVFISPFETYGEGLRIALP
jgi:hypothetical protein